MQQRSVSGLVAVGVAAWVAGAAQAAPRDVQFASVDLTTGVIELRNLGTETEDLSGWRFCTHNEGVAFRYTGSSGLNGVSLAPGESLFVHTLNDATGPGEIDVALLGGSFALPMGGNASGEAYGLQIYFPPVSFSNGATIADHVQWSFGGADDLSADGRSQAAVNGGVWDDEMGWVATDATTTAIILRDTCGNELHGPEDYQTPPGGGSARDVQIRSVDLAGGVIELFNFGAEAIDLSGWRFCTHDESVAFRYTSGVGLNGITLGSGESLFVHTLNDASGPGEINVALLGGSFALPMDGDDPGDAYAIGLYFPPVDFGFGGSIADHVQFSFAGSNDLNADARSGAAVAGGVWTGVAEWVATSAGTERIELVGRCGRELHGPIDYDAIGAPTPTCAGDVNGDGFTDVFDFGDLAANFGAGPGATREQGDLTGDGFVDVFDFGDLAADFGCTP